jgi:cell division protein FtsW (lipid II flippase)
MALTYTTSIERAEIGARDAARRIDTTDALLLVTSAVALLAIGLAYVGRLEALEAAERRRGGTPPVDLSHVTSVAQLEPALRLMLPDAADRGLAAQQLLQFLHANVPSGGTLPNVGAIVAVDVPVRALDDKPDLVVYAERLRAAREHAAAGRRDPPQVVPLFTSADLVLLKPALTVRTLETFRATLVTCTLLYIGAFGAIALLWRLPHVRGDRLLLGTAQVLTAIGFAVLVGRADPLRDSLLFVRYTEGIVIGLAVMAIVAFASVRNMTRLRDLSFVPLVGALFLSVLLILFGDGPGHSRAKVNLGPVQPIEAIRLLLALFLAGYFARRWELLRSLRSKSIRNVRLPSWLDVPRLEYVMPVLVGVAGAAAFFFLQRDLGPALLLACGFLAMYAVARSRAMLAAGGLTALIASFYIGYRLDLSETLADRVRMWQSPWDNGVRGGDQIAQSLWALATGGSIGSGLGLGDTRYLPAGHTDLVLAAVGEELGAIGILVAAGAYVLLAWRGLRIAQRAASDYEFFLAISLTLFLAVPALIMGAGVLGLVPLTGVVTPFLSYGGSAMTANLAALGMLSVIRNDRHASFSLEPFRVPTRCLGGGLLAAAICLAAGFMKVQVLQADEYAVRPHLSVQGDGGRRYQYNPRLLDVIRQIPRGTVYDRRGLPLATDSQEIVARAREEYAKLGESVDPACLTRTERCYPLAGKTFHILGDSRSRLNWSASNTSYVERDAEDSLRGFDDHATVVQTFDSVGGGVSMVRRDYRELLPLLRHRYQPGHRDVRAFLNRPRDLRLTVDARLQARERAAAVVLDPDSGDLLAAVSYPWPTAARSWSAGTVSEAGVDSEALLDRARYGLYPPGSTFKLLTAAAALRQSESMNRAIFSCTRLPDGRVGARIPGRGRPIRDDVLDTHPHGAIDMHDGMVRSCNAYFAQLAMRLGPDALLAIAAPVGIVMAPANSRSRLRETLPQAGYGQGDVLTTPLRMARVAAAFAADGVVYETGVIPARTRQSETLLAPDAARLIASYLRDAVLEGTGRTLRDHPVRIAGKTGTAELAGSPSHAWFIGFAPYGRATKRIAFAVLLENAGYGGLSAAPVAGEIVTAAAGTGLIR